MHTTRGCSVLAIVLIAGCRKPSSEPVRATVSTPQVVTSGDADVAPRTPVPAPAVPTSKLALADGRQDCAAVALGDGSVLVIGGYEYEGKPGPGRGLATVERLDLRTGTVRGVRPMGHSRNRHTATVLGDGRVLVVGGVTGEGAAAEVYDPARDRWDDVAAPSSWRSDRWGHSATLLADGRVLVAGGIVSAEDRVASDVDIFDPKTNRWTAAAPLIRARDEHAATLLRDGRVLVSGGRAFDPSREGIDYLDDAEVYDPVANRWHTVAPMHSARSELAAARLPDGRVLVVGGYKPNAAEASAEIFDPRTETWTPTAPLAQGRFDHTASVLEIGVVVAGGWQDRTNLATTEVFDPDTARWRAGPKLRVGRDAHCAVAMPNGLLLFGGQNARHFSVREVEAFPLRAF